MNKVVQLKDNVGNKYYNTEIPYSTEEIRIGTWINGKPLYRKVYQKDNVNDYAFYINMNHASEIINCYGYGSREQDGHIYFLNGFGTNYTDNKNFGICAHWHSKSANWMPRAHYCREFLGNESI